MRATQAAEHWLSTRWDCERILNTSLRSFSIINTNDVKNQKELMHIEIGPHCVLEVLRLVI